MRLPARIWKKARKSSWAHFAPLLYSSAPHEAGCIRFQPVTMEGHEANMNRHEADPKGDGGAQARQQHQRFIELTHRIVEQDTAEDVERAESSWVVACYRSRSTFINHFPDPEQREEMLRTLEDLADATDHAVDEVLESIEDWSDPIVS